MVNLCKVSAVIVSTGPDFEAIGEMGMTRPLNAWDAADYLLLEMCALNMARALAL